MGFLRPSAPTVVYQAPPAVPELPPAPIAPQYAATGSQGFSSGSAATTAITSPRAGGLGSTILTSGQGDLTKANTGKKSLLGE